MNGPSLLRDWHNLRVRTVRDLSNALARVPAGTTGTVRRSGRGLVFESDACQHCGIVFKVMQCKRHSFKVLTPESEWPNTKGKGRRI